MAISSVNTLVQSQILRPQVQVTKPPVIQTTTTTVLPTTSTRVATRGGTVNVTA